MRAEAEAVLSERSGDAASVADVAAPAPEPSGAGFTAAGSDFVNDASLADRESFAAAVALLFTVAASAARKIGVADLSLPGWIVTLAGGEAALAELLVEAVRVANVDSSEAGAW